MLFIFYVCFLVFCFFPITAWPPGSVPRVSFRLWSGINYSKTPCLDPRNGSVDWNVSGSCTVYIDTRRFCFSLFVVSTVYTRLHCKSRLRRHCTSPPISWCFLCVGPPKRPAPVVSSSWFVRWLFLRHRCPNRIGVGMSFSCCVVDICLPLNKKTNQFLSPFPRQIKNRSK